ncbi:unnamed protein product [Ceratitis capitata]|uniref:(Mediterranean fruit fly) hypothetical protein n=1 Tax=Ceratitis capitata TaxID=7213 RepID=A0A811UHL2_CERCA|nr:unnamed protein product [Ceratitis capitata]
MANCLDCLRCLLLMWFQVAADYGLAETGTTTRQKVLPETRHSTGHYVARLAGYAASLSTTNTLISMYLRTCMRRNRHE